MHKALISLIACGFAPTAKRVAARLGLVLVFLFVGAGCGSRIAQIEDIQRWSAKTRMRHGGLPVEALPRDIWKPLDLVNYEIGPGDVIDIRVLGQETLSFRDVTIPPGGKIPFPLVGSVTAEKKTSQQLGDYIEKALTPHLRDPKVLVTVNTYSRYVVSVIGSVQKPGVYPIQSGTRLLDMIVESGGLTLGGGSSGGSGTEPGLEMFIYRKVDNAARPELSVSEAISLAHLSPEEATLAAEAIRQPGTYQTIAIPVRDAVLDGRFVYNILLQPDDIIYIPPAGSALVHGRVNRFGQVRLGRTVHTLTGVLTSAGALRFGASSKVLVVRDNGPDREPDRILVNARKIYANKDNDSYPDVPLRDGDEVFVRAQWFRASLEWLGGVFNRGTQAGANLTVGP